MHFWKSGFWVIFGPIFEIPFLTIFCDFCGFKPTDFENRGYKKGVKNGSKSLQEGQLGSSRGQKVVVTFLDTPKNRVLAKPLKNRYWFWKKRHFWGPKWTQNWSILSEGHWPKSCWRLRWIAIFEVRKIENLDFGPKSLIWFRGAQLWRARASARASFVTILRIFWWFFFWNLRAQKSPYFGWV